jgi:hypothetical protein
MASVGASQSDETAKSATAWKPEFVVAIAGVVAGAVAAITGAGFGYLNSREDRSHQQAIAHEARVYDRRALIYLDALDLFKRLEEELGRSIRSGGGPSEPLFPTNKAIGVRLSQLRKGDSELRLRIVAFGSPPAVTAYEDAVNAATATLYDASEVWFLLPSDVDQDYQWSLSEVAKSSGSLREFSKLQSKYTEDFHDFLAAYRIFIDSAREDIG